MAEQVKRRVNAARIAVAFAAAGVIAGAAATATGAPGDLPANSVGTLQVRNDSLMHKDFKDGEVYSKDAVAGTFLKIDAAAKKFLKIDDANIKYLKIDDANQKFLKIDDANIKYLKIDDANQKFLKIDDANIKYLKIDDAANTYVKGEALNSYVKVESLAEALNSYIKLSVADSTFLKIQDAANTYVKGEALNSYVKVESLAEALNSYLKIDDANQKFVKIDGTAANSAKLGGLSAGDFVQGDGSVFTGTSDLVLGQVKPLVSVDRMFAVEIDNESGTPDLKLHLAPDGPPSMSFAFDGGGGTLNAGAPTATIPFDGSSDTEVVQILIGDEGPEESQVVGTLSISVVAKSGGENYRRSPRS